MKKEELYKYLELLGEELKKDGYHGEIILTGGAAMCLVHSARDMTKDIDALYEPKSMINDYVQKIAENNNLPKDWLNDSVKGFVDNKLKYDSFKKLPGLDINVVTVDYLLAMKLLSSRQGEKDVDDIKFLLNKMNIKTYDEAIKVLLTFYDEKRILPKTRYVLEGIFDK